MGGCCELPAVEPGARACSACGERGVAVPLQTVKALLTEVALRRVQLTHYRFCGDPACDVVVLGDAGDCFGTNDLRVPVWQKEPEGARLLCYCFGETESCIRSELREHRTQPRWSIAFANTSVRSVARVPSKSSRRLLSGRLHRRGDASRGDDACRLSVVEPGYSRTTTGQGAFTAVRQTLRSNFVSPGAARFRMSSARASGCALPTWMAGLPTMTLFLT